MSTPEIISFQGQRVFRWTRGHSSFLATPEHGARLLSWELGLADNSTRKVIYWPDNADWNNPKDIRGGNPVLFPFAGRSYADGKKLFWESPDKGILPMPQHGFAINGLFEVTGINEHGFSAQFVPNATAREAYPYHYRFTATYRFHELRMEVVFALENLESFPLPWAPGHHFYFMLPWHKGLSRKDYFIKLPAKKACRHGTDGKLIPLKEKEMNTTFDNPEICDRIHYHFTENRVQFGPKSGEENVTLIINPKEGMSQNSSVVTWSETAESPFYCIEPWLGLPNSVEHKKGLHFVNPGATETFSVEVSLME